MSGSGISGAICKHAPLLRQITTQFFSRQDALPATQPTVSKQWRHLSLHKGTARNRGADLLSAGFRYLLVLQRKARKVNLLKVIPLRNSKDFIQQYIKSVIVQEIEGPIRRQVLEDPKIEGKSESKADLWPNLQPYWQPVARQPSSSTAV